MIKIIGSILILIFQYHLFKCLFFLVPCELPDSEDGVSSSLSPQYQVSTAPNNKASLP